MEQCNGWLRLKNVSKGYSHLKSFVFSYVPNSEEVREFVEPCVTCDGSGFKMIKRERNWITVKVLRHRGFTYCGNKYAPNEMKGMEMKFRKEELE